MSGQKYLLVRSLRRRLLVAGTSLAAFACTGAARSQAPEKLRRIGILLILSPSTESFDALRLALRDLGWIEGKNIVIECRYAEGRNERLPELAAELVRLNVDVIVVRADNSGLAAQRATLSIPIVMTFMGDPVAAGLIKSLARPGGNITGLSHMSLELTGKRLELLKEMVPKLSRVAVLWSPPYAAKARWQELQRSARQLGIQLYSMDVRHANEFDKAFEDAAKAGVGALFIIPSTLISNSNARIADLAVKSRLPSMHDFSYFPVRGGLMSYGARPYLDLRVAIFVDKILKGAKPSDLPVEQATKFELVINLKTAKALGLTVPQSILVRAHRVIE